MTRRRWIADEVSGNRAALTGDHAAHLIRVLRARIGQEFDIAHDSRLRRGRIVHIADSRVEFELGLEIPAAGIVEITLVLSIFKFDRMEWAIEKCVELGVRRIIPLVARRTDSHLAAASAKRVERWRKIALQASEQSRSSVTPEITDLMKFQEALGLQAPLRIVLSESETETQLRDVVTLPASGLTLAIGPEGGWTEDELQQFQQAGWIAASLGPKILRAETAAIAATAIITSGLSS